ncbi:MAG: FAD-dependent oxidoreductase [Rhodobacteraceae bacterium]|nr:FAD-dependent oxidoreductase [Paracoccaceae bacterium]
MRRRQGQPLEHQRHPLPPGRVGLLPDPIDAMADDIRLSADATGIRKTSSHVDIDTPSERVSARNLVVCPGVQADRLAGTAGLDPDFRIVPFRGEYFRLAKHWDGRVSHLIYPVPNPDLPFLGIHLTNMIDGSITGGPNAMLGMAREGYPKFSFSARDVRDYVSFPGFWKMLGSKLGPGLEELRNSVFRSRYLVQCRKCCPGLVLDDPAPLEAGIRAQAVGREGKLIHNFLFLHTDRTVFVCNAPSPAATSALPIGERIAGRMLERSHNEKAA